MDFALLGPVEVRRRGRRIDIGGPKQRVILAHLLIRANQVVSADRLIDDVWGDEASDAARKSLHAYISRLRRVMTDGARIDGRPPGYALEVDSTRIDAVRFVALLDEARRLKATRPEAALELLSEALALWRGPALDDLHDEPSLQAEIARLEELRMSAREERLDIELGLGRVDAVIAELEVLTREQPLRERLWALLMQALYRAGRQGDALSAYLRARTVLSEELGIEPSAELQALQARILAQDPALEGGLGTLRGYQLQERLGDGRAGRVYRALQPHVGREVAIRVIDPALATQPGFVRRFETDAQAVARLEHPHVVPLYDYWRGPDGAFLVHRHLRGGTLRRAMDGGRLEALDIARVAVQVASALAAAHHAGVTHGNLHAGNVLLDERGDAYLSDFGVAQGAPSADQHALGLLISELVAAGRGAGGEVPDDVDEVLARATAPDPTTRFADVAAFHEALVNAFGGTATWRAPVAQVSTPFKGLRAFQEADHAEFFGRERLVAELVERLAERGPGHRFLAVVGPSGSGKSSVVRAGLLPALRRGALPGAEAWFVAEMFPGAAPFHRLDEALVGVALEPPPTFLDLLTGDPRGIAAAVERSLPHDGSELLLVIDQFEELFTLTDDDAERGRFLDALALAVVDPHSRLRVVVTLRADFFDRPLVHRAMAELLGSRSVTVGPLAPDELARAVVQPAERAGARVEPELTAALVTDVLDQPGALPLLQYTLTELFEARRGGRMMLDTYRALGGIGGAVARRAEQLYAGFEASGREATRQLFLRLVALGEGVEDTRRRVPLGELTGMEGQVGRDVPAVVDAFGQHRLLSFDRDPATREPTVEVAHEALLRAWGRLRDWIAEARDDLRLQRQLTDAAVEWDRQARDPNELWRGARLEHAEAWVAGGSVALTDRERAFVAAGVAARDAERIEEEERRAHELQLERRSVHRLRALAVVLAAGAFVAAVLTGVALAERNRAERAALETHARELAFAAGNVIAEDPELAVLLALEAVATTRDVDGTVLRGAEEALHRAVQASRVVRTLPSGGAVFFAADGDLMTTDGPDAVIIDLETGDEVQRLSGHADGIFNAVLSADGRTLATNSLDRSTRVWDVTSGRELWSESGEGYEPVGVAISPDGRLVAITSLPGDGPHTLDLRDLASGRLIQRVEVQGAVGLNFTPDGRLLAAAGVTGVTIYRVPDGEVEVHIDTSPFPMTDVAFSPDGQHLVAGGFDRLATIYALDGTVVLRLFGHEGNVEGIAYSRDGTRIATSGIDGTARVHDATTGEALLTLAGHGGAVINVDFSPDGSLLATAATDGTARVWDVRPEGDREWLTITRQPALIDVTLSPDGSWVGTSGQDGSARLFDADGRPVAELTHDGVLRRIDFSPDGSLVATASLAGTARVWQVPSGELAWTIEPEPPPNGPPPGVSRAAFSPDGTRLALSQGDGQVAVWEVASRTLLARLPVAQAPVSDVAWGPNGERIAFGALDGSAGVWDVMGQSQVSAYTGHVGPNAFHSIMDVAFSPDGSLVASVGFDSTAAIWEAASGDERHRLRGPTGEVWSVAFSPDGRRLATGGADSIVRLWDVTTGGEVLALPGHSSNITAVEFSRDGTRLATASDSEAVRVYALVLDDLLQMAQDRVTRSLTDAECRQYLGLEECPSD
jgi:WD40 repeat protein/DNA-binding SARP family transcriptional activator